MPSKPAGNSNQTTTSSQQVQLPQWVDNAAQNIYQQGQDTAQNLLPSYTGQRVADLTGGQQAAIQGLWNNQGFGQPEYQAAQSAAQGLTGYQSQQVTPGFLSGTDLSAYMNPYTQSVIDPSMKLLDQQRQLANNQIADMADKTKAFGGSRQGVAEGVNDAQSALLGGQLGAQLNSANFMNAQGMATNDLNRGFQGQLANQQADLAGGNLRLNAANSLGNLTQMSGNQNLQQIMAALQGQGMLQQQNQQQLTGQQQAYAEQQQNPIQQLQILLSTIGGIPYGHSQFGTQTGLGPTSNPAMMGLGGASALTSIGGQLSGLLGGSGGAAAGADGLASSGLGSLTGDAASQAAGAAGSVLV